MPEHELTTRRFSINALMAEPQGIQNLRGELTADVQTLIVPEGNTPSDTLQASLEHAIYAHGKTTELPVVGKPNIIVTGSNHDITQIDSWPGIRRHIQTVPIELATSSLDLPRLKEEYGIEISEKDLETASLLAAMLVANTSESTVNQRAFITPVSPHDHPLLWMKWAEKQRGEVPLATQITEFSLPNAGLLFQSTTFEPYDNPEAQAVYESLGIKKWTPSAQMLILNEAVKQIPLATSNDVGRLMQSLATAEIARQTGNSLYRVIVERQRKRNIPFDHKDEGTRRLADALEIMQTGLPYISIEGLQGKNLTKATPPDIRRINRLLLKHTGSALIPSWSELREKGIVNQSVIEKLRKTLTPKHFQGADIAKSRLRIKRPEFQSGPIPDWNPKDFAGLLKLNLQHVEYIKSLGPQAIQELKKHIWALDGGGRPFYSVATRKYLPEYFGDFFDLGIYNLPRFNGKSEHARTMNLWTDEMAELRNGILDYLKNGNFVAGTAFVDETTTLRKVLNYANKRVGEGRVVAADHGRSQTSTDIAKETNVRVANFAENISKINWRALAKHGIIPKEILDENGLPMGLKGINTVNMIVELAKMEKEGKINDDTWVLLTDADIKNIGETDDYKKEDWYDPYLYLGMAIKDAEDKGVDLNAVHLAKTGVGRNNYNTHFMFDDMAQSRNKDVAGLGYYLSTQVWPHTESRAYKWKVLKKFLLAKDMQIEQTFDLCVAHMDIISGQKHFAQVISEVPKIEDRVSPSNREWGMMNNIADGVKDFKTSAKMNKALPMNMGFREIRKTNKRFAARGHFQSVTVDEYSTSREPQIALSDALLPSWELYVNNGYILDETLLN